MDLWRILAKIFKILKFKNDSEKEFDISEEVSDLMEKVEENTKSVFPTEELVEIRGMQNGIFKGDSNLERVDWTAIRELQSLELGCMRRSQLLWIISDLASIPGIRENLVNRGISRDFLEVEENSEKPKDSNFEQLETKMEKISLMQNMAQLWLQQEVNELESGARGGGGSKSGQQTGGLLRGMAGLTLYSPYIIVDHLALAFELDNCKRLVGSRKFAVIVPTEVIQELDRMKRSNDGARTAIRWMERQFQEGNRWLRSQKQHESETVRTDTTFITGAASKKDRTSFLYDKVTECCNYFARQRKDENSQTSSLAQGNSNKVTWLSAEDPSGNVSPPDQGKKLIAENIGIKICQIDTFVSEHLPPRTQRSRRDRGHRNRKRSK